MTRNEDLINYLKNRRSTPLPFLSEPAPNKEELEQILTIACRVPDHGKLTPWRLIIYKEEDRAKIGKNLAKILSEKETNIDKETIRAEEMRFFPAPLTIGVVSKPIKHAKIPEFEQFLSAGAVALNLLYAANAFGYGAQWVTRWFSYDKKAAKMLGAKEGEKFVAFIHIGTPTQKIEDRERPKIEEIISYWRD